MSARGTPPSLTLERSVGWPRVLVAGVDEVGRGPLAGEVVAAAVILPNPAPYWVDTLRDSKALLAKRREALFDLIMAQCGVGIGRGSLADIARLNILWAAMAAMARAVRALPTAPGHVLIDGNRVPEALGMPATAVVRGDSQSASIAAASIVAKVTRDREMVALDRLHPQYGWAQNKGYPTAHHRAALARFGATPYHRAGFKGVRTDA